MSEEAHAFLMGSKVPSLAFPEIGTTHNGIVTSYEKRQDRDMQGNPKVYENGDPMYVVIFTLQTELRDKEIEDDDGLRKLYARGAALGAIRDAVRKSKHRGQLDGGELLVRYSGDGEPPQKGFNAPKEYEAKYVPPVDDPNEEPF